MLVWMDLEMTGLDPERDVIVEIATLVTDDDLNIIEEGPDLVVSAPTEALENMDPFVVKMHTKSGLLEEIRRSNITLEQAGKLTLEFIQRHVKEPRTVPLAGNSIGNDRRFLLRYLPDIENYLHYRVVDVSTIKELSKRWYPEATKEAPGKNEAHRAMDDIKESVNELKYYRSKIFVA